MDNLIQFLLNEKEELIKEEGILSERIDKLTIENEQIENKITELIKGVDTTFEVFSPNSMDTDYNVSEINKLKHMLSEHEGLLKSYIERKTEIKNKLTNVYNAISMYERMQGTEQTMHRDFSQYQTEKRVEVEKIRKIGIEIAELETRRYERILSNTINPIIDSLSHKTELCDSFILQDINRSRMELNGLKEGLSTLKNKTEDYMFHVKHSRNVSRETQSLAENIEQYIKDYQTISITFTNIGEDIQMLDSDIENYIKILYELIENSISHGAATQIQIYLNVEVTERLRKKVILSVHDNGCGFNIENIHRGSQYGLQMVEKRISLYNGEVKIESNKDSGTTVLLNIVY